jgi:hypothetical protein
MAAVPDVDRVDDAIGTVEQQQGSLHLSLKVGVAEADVRVHLPGLAAKDPFGLRGSSPFGGRAGELPAVESLRKEEDVLAPLDGVERPRHLAEGLQKPEHAVAIDRALAPGAHDLHVLQGVLQDAVGLRELGPRRVGTVQIREPGGVALRRFRDGETQRIGSPVRQRREAERFDGRGELARSPENVTSSRRPFSIE